MNLISCEIKEYLDMLKTKTPAPGGGAACALSAAQGVALNMMVVELTLGKEKYEEYFTICEVAMARSEELYKYLVSAIDADAESYNMLAMAYKLPKDTEAQRATREKEIAEKTIVATEVPFRVMELSYDGIMVANTLLGKSNPNVASDIGVAALQFISAIKGAWLNVMINLPGIKDNMRATYFLERGQMLIDSAEEVAKKIYEEVLKDLQ